MMLSYLLLIACGVASVSSALPRSSSSIFAGGHFEPWFQCVNFQVKGTMQGVVDRCSSCVLAPENAKDRDCSNCCGGSLGNNQYLICEVGQSCCVRLLGKKAGGRVLVKQSYLETYDGVEGNTCANFFLALSPPGISCGNKCALGLDDTGTKRLDCSKNGYLLPDSKTAFNPTSECASPAQNVMSRQNASSGSTRQDKSHRRSPTASESRDGQSASESNCFPGDAVVVLASGKHLRMDSLKIGDEVKVGPGTFSKVFMFTHKDPKAKASYKIISTESKAMIKITPGHYLYSNKLLTLAQNVRAGDFVTLEDGSESIVETVRTVQGTPDGLFNPQTIHGDLVVNGILASTYTAAIDPTAAHAALLPLRALHLFAGVRWGGLEGDSAWRTMVTKYSMAFGSSARTRL